MVDHQRQNSQGNYHHNIYTYMRARWAPHFHTNFEMIHVMRGTLRVTVNGNNETMDEGDYGLILSHQIHSLEGSEDSLFWISTFSEQFVPLFAKQIKDRQGTHSVFRCDPEVDAFLKDTLILSESSLMMKKACFYAFCDQFLQKVPLENRKSRNEALICQILDYVATHYRKELSLESLAKEFGYEYHYLSRLLNHGYQIRFSDLVNQYRVDHAVRLLESTDLPLADIAADSGFRSIRSFHHTFKALTGSTPSHFIASV